MPCCCIKTLNLCKVPVCGSLVIYQAVQGLESGAESGSVNNYSLVLDYLDKTLTLTEEQTEGENISFDVSMLNENFEFTGKVYNSNGDIVIIESEGEDYDCIKFRTVINTNL